MDVIDAIIELAKQLDPLSIKTPEVSIKETSPGRWKAKVSHGNWAVSAESWSQQSATDGLRMGLVRENRALMDRCKQALKTCTPNHLNLVQPASDHKEGA